MTTIKDTVRFLKTHDDTKGEYNLLEVEIYSGAGPPLHYHKVINHKFKVLEGELRLQVDDTLYILNAGDEFEVPAMVPHRESSASGKKLKCLVESRPAHKGYEDFMVMTYSPDPDAYTEEEQTEIYVNADTYKP
jgi:quercetin dioxygenase-like cupin family protein